LGPRGVFGGPLRHSRAPEHPAHDDVVPLVTRVLVYRLLTLLQSEHGRPRLGPRRGVVNGDFVAERIWSDPREAFDDAQGFRGPHEVAGTGEIRRVDDEGVAFPSAARVAAQFADARWKVRTPVDRNDASFMNGLEGEHDGPSRLDDLIVPERARTTDVAGAETWNAVCQTAQRVAEILRARGESCAAAGG